jgi:predicted MFS family arabinose efflux permease
MENNYDPAQATVPAAKVLFTGYQKFVIAMLSFLQFTIILDFMIMSPLGAVMMPALSMSTSQFGLVVSAYAFSAGASGLLAAGFADKFDRKKLLMFFYVGFMLGTVLCALATSFHFLFVARMVTGLFGGVIGSVIMAITTDLFPMSMRGRVMGFMQTSFAASQILGIPIGLYISNLWGWHMPFLAIVGMSLIAGVIIVIYLKPINEHLKLPQQNKALRHLMLTLKNKEYAFAFLTTGLMSIGGFMLMPFGSAFTVNNLGIELEKLPMIYLVTGICAIFIGPLVGKASDLYGKLKVFLFGASLSIVTVVIYTNLGVTPLYGVMFINVVMFCAIFSRMIPSQALMSAIPIPENRGAFMAVSSSLQQLAGGLASVVAGLIVYQETSGQLIHFDVLGYILVCTVLLSAYCMYRISQKVNAQ